MTGPVWPREVLCFDVELGGISWDVAGLLLGLAEGELFAPRR